MEFPPNFFDSPGSTRPYKALTQQRKHFAVRAAALAGILIQNDIIESLTQNSGLIA